MIKGSLFLLGLLAITSAKAQVLTYDNEPAIGENENYWLCDSNTVTLAEINGPDCTWDYSNLLGYGDIRWITMTDATSSTWSVDYPAATKLNSLSSAVHNYFYSDASGRTSPGYVYVDGFLGEVKAVWNVDEEIVMNYPFDYGSVVTDYFEGIVYTQFGDLPATGSSRSEIDGYGTFIFPYSTVENVYRYHLADTTFTNFGGEIQIIRNQYEYYTNGYGYPIFLHATITIIQDGNLVGSSSVVYSENSTPLLGKNELSTDKLIFYPNPSGNVVHIDNSAQSISEVTIFDTYGNRVVRKNLSIGLNELNISDLAKGMYYLQYESEGQFYKKKLEIIR